MGGRRLDIFRDVNSLKADIKKVTKPTNNLNTSESIISDIDENKAITNNENIDIDTLAEIAKVENAILKKIESEVLVDDNITSTNKANPIDEKDDQTTETIKKENESTNKAGLEATTENIIITQEGTEVVLTTVTKDTKEDVTDSTEPYTVATIITTESPDENDKIITTVSIVDIITGNLDTTTNSDIEIDR